MATTDTPLPPWAVTTEKRSEAVRRIVAAAHPRRVIMFGSQARGEADQDSDLDLLVIVDEPGHEWQRTVELRRALHGMIMGVDIIVATQEKFEYWRDTPGTVYYEANLDGQIVYDRGT